MTDRDATGSAGPRGRWSIEARARSSAPVEEVWPLIGEADRWKEWSFLDRSGRLEDGAPVPDGVGAVRRFTSHGIGSTEEVVAYDPPHHLGYAIVKGFPVRHYRADVTCEPDGTGTAITWSASFDEKFPGTGHLMVAVLTRVIGRFATAAARFAEQHHSPAG
jgi:uncharacterized protein YndB with AHSA1/START domain